MGSPNFWTVCHIKFPTPRILKEPEGWRRSSFAKTWQPAAAERDSDAMHGVLIQGGLSPAVDINLVDVVLRGFEVAGMVMIPS